MPTRSDIRSDRRASAPGNGYRLGLFRFVYALIPKLTGSVPLGASTSEQPDHVAVEMHGGDSNSTQEDDVVSQRDAGAFISRQLGMEMDSDAPTNRQYNDAGEIEEEAPRNANQGEEKPETEGDICERFRWVTSIQTKLDEAIETETISIPKVSKGYDEVVEKAYEPRVISIGPYHWEKPHLNNMQKRKWQCLKDIRGLQQLDLNALFKELKKVEEQARSFYPESELERLQRGDFLEMLLLDGCFIVDYLRRASSSDESKAKIWSDHQIGNDLLLLENQLPFFVVECIYRLVKQTEDDKELINTALKFFHKISPKRLGVHEQEKRNFKHLLHLYHAYLFYNEHDGWEEGAEQGASQVRTIPSAILLQEAGIKFKKRKMEDRAIDIRFRDGVMNMTPLVIDAFSISQFLNLMKFEQAHPDMEPRFTAFLQFMDCIINTAEDVALLRKKDILDHAFGSDEEVASIFNRLTSGIFHQLSWELKDVYENTNEHYKNNWKRWWATFLRDRFGTPMAAIAFLAAVLLLSFDFIQTFFSVYSYFRPRSAS